MPDFTAFPVALTVITRKAVSRAHTALESYRTRSVLWQCFFFLYRSLSCAQRQFYTLFNFKFNTSHWGRAVRTQGPIRDGSRQSLWDARKKKSIKLWLVDEAKDHLDFAGRFDISYTVLDRTILADIRLKFDVYCLSTSVIWFFCFVPRKQVKCKCWSSEP